MPNIIRSLHPNFDKKLVEGLYLKDKLTLIQIGNKLDIPYSTLQVKMHKYGIPLRPGGPPRPLINYKDLKRLYLKKGLSSRKIAKIYKCAYSCIDSRIRIYGLPIKTLAAAHIKTKRKPFTGTLAEKAYLIGFRIGDLRVRKQWKNSETLSIDCGSTKPKQILLIKNLFKKYGHLWVSKPSRSGKTQIEIHLDLSFSFLLPNYKKFPKWITDDHEFFMNAIGGFVDAEGCFCVHDDKRSFFSLGNYNLNILKQIQHHLKRCCVKSSLYRGCLKGYKDNYGYVRNGTYWILSICKKADLYKFSNTIKIYLRHKDRIACLVRVIKNIDKRNIKYGYIGM